MTEKRDFLLRNVIKEELVILTMHRDEAAILNQFLYWTPRSKTYKQFLSEETIRMKQELVNFEGGWIYKTAEELKHELMMIDTNVKTIRKYLNSLVEKGYLLRQKNPKWKADRTYHYRINLRKIVDQVNRLGHHLEGFEQFSLNVNEVQTYCLYDREQGHRIGSNLSSTNDHNIHMENDNLNVDEEKLDFPNGKMSAAIPEITTENTNQKIPTNNYININDEREFIKKHYLSMSSRSSLSIEDEQLIEQALDLVKDGGLIWFFMNECYELRKSFKSAPGREPAGIWSFKYFYNYIVKEFEKTEYSKPYFPMGEPF